jgi:hypothetical protein
MKALEHLLIQELKHIRVTESKLQDAYPKLRATHTADVQHFVNSLLALQHRAARLEEMLDAIGENEPIAA